MHNLSEERRAKSEESFAAAVLCFMLLALRLCGQAAHNMWAQQRKSTARVHSRQLHTLFIHKNAVLFRFLNTAFTQLIRCPGGQISSVIGYLYPLSTGPITKTTKYSY